MLRSIGDYIDIVGAETISKIFKKANKLYGKRLANVNATFLGGGVAEILSRMVPLMNEVGLDVEWRTIHGSPAFFDLTKSFHNAMQSGPLDLDNLKKSRQPQKVNVSLDGVVKSPKTTSPLMGEGWSEGENSAISIGCIPLPLVPSRQGRGNGTFYEFINFKRIGIQI